jgi:hypothetical protein
LCYHRSTKARKNEEFQLFIVDYKSAGLFILQKSNKKISGIAKTKEISYHIYLKFSSGLSNCHRSRRRPELKLENKFAFPVLTS